MAEDSQQSLTDFGSAGADEDGDDGEGPGRETEAEIAEAVAGNGGNGDSTAVVDMAERRYPDADGTTTLAVTQVDYTIEGRGDEERPVLHVFGRNADREPVHVRVHEFEPYFYAPLSNFVTDAAAAEKDPAEWTEDDLDPMQDPEQQFDRLTGRYLTGTDGEPFESIRGERLLKITGQTPRDVGQLRDRFDHYEADILFPNRLLIDRDIRSGVRVPVRREDDGDGNEDGDSDGDAPIDVHHAELEPVEMDVEPRVCTFDIEVDDRRGFPEDGEEPIVCLTSHDSYDDEYVVWLYTAPDGIEGPDGLPGYEPIEDDLEVEVRSFEREEAMLSEFVDYIRETDPDVLTGWNFTDFDAPYLLDRIEELATPENDLAIDPTSRVNEVWRSDWQGPNVKGRVVFDLLYAYKRTQFTELDSYRLDAVGETELDVGKERYPGDIGDLWEDDPERLLEYNLRDVELCVELDRKQEIVPFWQEVASFVGCKLEDATTPGDAVDMYILHEVFGNFVLPSKGSVEAEDYEGGAVFDPITGVKENVSVLDLKSLYPMSMVTINASPETKVGDDYDGETYHAPNGTQFRKEPDGIIRTMVDDLLTEREEKKGLRNDHEPGTDPYEQYDRQQQAVKVIMNCFTPDTDVLTPEGVRNIRDLDVGDGVYSLDPETMQMEVKPVVETQAYPDYRGDLVDIQTSKVDFSVTPNHRMLVRKDDRNGASWDDYRFVEAGDLNESSHYELPHDWEGPSGSRLGRVDIIEFLDCDFEVWADNDVHGHTLAAEVGWYPDKMEKQGEDGTGYVFSVDEFEEHREYLDEHCSAFYVHADRGRKWIPRFYDGDDFLDLLAWYITEGNVYTSEDKQFGENFRGSATTVQIAQEAVADGGTSESDHAAIGGLLDRMGFDYYVDDRSYQFTSKLLGEWLEETCGGDSFEKRIPAFVFEASREQKERFLNTLIAGDGDRQPNSWRYTTSSESLRDDVLRLCVHLGLTPSVNHDSGSWRIYCTEDGKNSFCMHRSGGSSTADSGVYCVTVEDNHTLMAGRNGKFQFVGQSLYGVLGWDRFRLYDKEMGAAVTATGREVIEYTSDIVEENDQEIVYGDTDSVMVEFGGGIDKETAIERSFELEEQINDSYDEFAMEQLDAAHHRFQIEFEKLYRRFFQAGKKKRYAGHIVWKEGKDVDDIDITGFEYKRSDIAPVTKRVQHRVIEMIVTGADLEDVRTYVHEEIESFKEGNADLDDIGIPGGIGKKLDAYDTATAQVRGAKYANLLLGTNFGRGSKPMRLYLENVDASFFERIEEEEGLDPHADPLYGEFKRDPDVICFEYADQVPEEFHVDYEKMLEKTLKGPIARILEALGVSWQEVESGQEQTGLGSFM